MSWTPHLMAHTAFPKYAQPPPPPTPAVAAPAPAPTPAPVKPSHPPMLSPMAGTFYRNPGPGEPPFVQIKDVFDRDSDNVPKISWGNQVVRNGANGSWSETKSRRAKFLFVEAMKLMNEIELNANQSGTVVEILAENGKPISMESPLFSIKP